MFSNMPEWDENFLKRRYLRKDDTFDYCFLYRTGKDKFIHFYDYDDIRTHPTLQSLNFLPGLTSEFC